MVQQFVAQCIEPGLLALPRVDFNQTVAGMLAERVFIMTGSVPFPPQLSLDERRGVESL